MKEWLESVEWFGEPIESLNESKAGSRRMDVVEGKVVRDTLNILTQAGVVQPRSEEDEWNVSDFVNQEIASII